MGVDHADREIVGTVPHWELWFRLQLAVSSEHAAPSELSWMSPMKSYYIFHTNVIFEEILPWCCACLSWRLRVQVSTYTQIGSGGGFISSATQQDLDAQDRLHPDLNSFLPMFIALRASQYCISTRNLIEACSYSPVCLPSCFCSIVKRDHAMMAVWQIGYWLDDSRLLSHRWKLCNTSACNFCCPLWRMGRSKLAWKGRMVWVNWTVCRWDLQISCCFAQSSCHCYAILCHCRTIWQFLIPSLKVWIPRHCAFLLTLSENWPWLPLRQESWLSWPCGRIIS